MPRPVIQDRAVIVPYKDVGRSPIGEARIQSDPVPTYPMSPAERANMVSRLGSSIDSLMEEARSTYQANCYKPGTAEVDPDYITRLSTNEFFFYTKEPLSLQEFETLQNKIAAKAKTLSPGVQLILGSFAVQTPDGKVMNVTPHITGGNPPNFHFIVKNNTSQVDVRYDVPDGSGRKYTPLDIKTHPPHMPFPSIMVDGVPRNFTFNNVIPCKTPGGTPFLTAVDICLDHMAGVAKANVEALARTNPQLLNLPISHVVVSNWIGLYKDKCLGPVMHVDPNCSPMQCKENARQVGGTQQRLPFGRDAFRIFDVEKCPILAKEDILRESLSKTLTSFGITVMTPLTPYRIMSDDLKYLCLKKYLEKNNIPYSSPTHGQIEIGDSFFRHPPLPTVTVADMIRVFSSPQSRDQIIADVRQDRIDEQRAFLGSQANLLQRQVSTIQRFEFNTSGDALQPINGARFFFTTQEEANVFVAAIQKYDPSLPVQMVTAGGYVECSPRLLQDPAAYNAVVQNYQAAQNDALAAREKTSLSQALTSIDAFQITVSSQSPFKMGFSNELSYLCLKKYLDRGNIPYSEPAPGIIQLPDTFFLQRQSGQMAHILSNPEGQKEIIAAVRQDKMHEQRAFLGPQANLLQRQVSTIQRFEFNTSGDALQPINGARFFFTTQEEASVFVAAIQKYDPSLPLQMVAAGGYVECSPRLLQDPAIYNAVVQNYQAAQKGMEVAPRPPLPDAFNFHGKPVSDHQPVLDLEAGILSWNMWAPGSPGGFAENSDPGIAAAERAARVTLQVQYLVSILKDNPEIDVVCLQEMGLKAPFKDQFITQFNTACQTEGLDRFKIPIPPVLAKTEGASFGQMMIFDRTKYDLESYQDALLDHKPYVSPKLKPTDAGYQNAHTAQQSQGGRVWACKLKGKPGFPSKEVWNAHLGWYNPQYGQGSKDLIEIAQRARDAGAILAGDMNVEVGKIPEDKRAPKIKAGQPNKKDGRPIALHEAPIDAIICDHNALKAAREAARVAQAAGVKQQEQPVDKAAKKPEKGPLILGNVEVQGIDRNEEGVLIVRGHVVGFQDVRSIQVHQDGRLTNFQGKAGVNGYAATIMRDNIERIFQHFEYDLPKPQQAAAPIPPQKPATPIHLPPMKPAQAAIPENRQTDASPSPTPVAPAVPLAGNYDLGKGNKVIRIEANTGPEKGFIVHGQNAEGRPRSIQVHADGSIRNFKGTLSMTDEVSLKMKEQIASIFKHFGHVLPEQKQVENKYVYKESNPSGGRFHLFAASPNPNFANYKQGYQNARGDYVKTKILEEFKTLIENTSTKKELDDIKKRMTEGDLKDKHDVLATGQGLITKITGIKTSSIRALEDMFQQKEGSIATVPARKV